MFTSEFFSALIILVIGIASPLCAGQEEAAAGLGSQLMPESEVEGDWP